MVNDFIRLNNIILSKSQTILFQLTDKITQCNLELFSTTEGLYIVYEPEKSSRKYSAWFNLDTIE